MIICIALFWSSGFFLFFFWPLIMIMWGNSIGIYWTFRSSLNEENIKIKFLFLHLFFFSQIEHFVKIKFSLLSKDHQWLNWVYLHLETINWIKNTVLSINRICSKSVSWIFKSSLLQIYLLSTNTQFLIILAKPGPFSEIMF